MHHLNFVGIQLWFFYHLTLRNNSPTRSAMKSFFFPFSEFLVISLIFPQIWLHCLILRLTTCHPFCNPRQNTPATAVCQSVPIRRRKILIVNNLSYFLFVVSTSYPNDDVRDSDESWNPESTLPKNGQLGGGCNTIPCWRGRKSWGNPSTVLRWDIQTSYGSVAPWDQPGTFLRIKRISLVPNW